MRRGAATPAPRAAPTRIREPSLRRRSLRSKSRSILRGSIRFGSAVSWLTTASGRAWATASATALASSASAIARLGARPRAPARRSPRCGTSRVTSWPAASSAGTSRRPITPVAPARKTLTGDREPGRAVGRLRSAPSAARRRRPLRRSPSRAGHALAEAGGAEPERALKRERRFSTAIRCTSSTSWASPPRRSRSASSSSGATTTGVVRHRDREVEHEPLGLVEALAVAVAVQLEELPLVDALRASLEGADVLAHLAALHDRRLQHRERAQVLGHAAGARDALLELGVAHELPEAVRANRDVRRQQRLPGHAPHFAAGERVGEADQRACGGRGRPRRRSWCAPFGAGGGEGETEVRASGLPEPAGDSRTVRGRPFVAGGGAPHPGQQQRAREQREEVEAARPLRVRGARVDEVVDGVQAELRRRDREHGHAPGRPPDRDAAAPTPIAAL